MRLHVFSLFAVSLLLVNGCNFSFTTANIASANMTKGEDGQTTVTTYAPEDTFYCFVTMNNAPSGTELKGTLMAVDTESGKGEVASATLVTGSGTHHFKYTLPKPWPKGDYQVDLYIQGKLVKSVPFKVE